MKLVILTAILAVCGAARLDRSYLPPATARTAGGSPGALLAPLEGPSGSYTNDDQGVVVDAATPGTRTAEEEPTGLGGPRSSYGSTDSRVGDAAFRLSSPGGPNTRIAPGFESITGAEENTGGPSIRIVPGFSEIVAPQGSDNDKTRASTLKFANEIGADKYSYGYETDNGITMGENGVAADGINAQGGYSYKGDDGKVYSVSYTADKGGYKPHGSHLPTPPPIPDEILKSLEQNAKEEAAGHVDDGSYDAQKYNEEGDYRGNNGDESNNRQSVSGGDATGSGSFGNTNLNVINHNLGTLGVGNQHLGSVQGSHQFGSSDSSSVYKHTGFDTKNQGFGVTGHSESSVQGEVKPYDGFQTTETHGQNQGSGYYSHTTQNRFAGQLDKPVGSNGNRPSATATASTGNVQNHSPTFQNYPGLRLPTPSNGDSAYSSAVTTGFGSATAFASTGSAAPNFKNQFGSGAQFDQGFNFNTDSSKIPLPNFNAFNPASASALASVHRQASSAEVLSTGQQSAHGGNGYNVVSLKEQANQLQTTPGHLTQSSQNIDSLPTRFGETVSQTSFQKPNEAFNIHAKPTSGTSATASTFSGSQHTQLSNDNTHTSGANSGLTPEVLRAVPPTNVPATELSTPFESNQSPDRITSVFSGSNSFGTNSGKFIASTPTQPSTFPQQSSFQYKPQIIHGSVAQTGSHEFISNSPKPTQGSDSSYYYNQPSKPFAADYQGNKLSSSQASGSLIEGSTQFSNNRHSNVPVAPITQQGFKYPNTPTTASVAPTTTSSSSNGITQATISSFPSVTPTQSSQYQSQSSQFGLNPTTQIEQLPSSQTQFEAFENQHTFSHNSGTQLGQKPSSQSLSQLSSSQAADIQKPEQGTIYEYNKPTSGKESASTSAHVPTSQTVLHTKPGNISLGSESTQFTQPKPFGSSSDTSSYQQSQIQGPTFGSQSQFGIKPIVQSQSLQFDQQSISPTENTQNPVQQGTIYEYNKPTDKADSQTKPETTFGSQNIQFGNPQTKPFGTSSQQSLRKVSIFGAESTNKFGQKPQIIQNTGLISSFENRFGQTNPKAGSNIQQAQISSFSKPIVQSQSALHQSQFGSPGFQFGHKPLTGQKDSSLSFGQQNQGELYQYNKPSENISLGKETSTTSSGSQFPAEPSSTTSTQVPNQQFSNKPFGSLQTGTTFQQNQFAKFPSYFDQKQTQGVGLASSAFSQTQPSQFVKKPLGTTISGSNYQHSQFGSTFGSKFNQKPQTTQGTTFNNNAPNGQIIQTTNQFGYKPFSASSVTSSSFSQNQFGTLPGSQSTQFAQSTKLTQGPTLTSENPISTSQVGNNFQQATFGTSTGSQFAHKPQSFFTSRTPSKGQSILTNQFGQKPLGSSQTGTSIQQTGSSFASSFPSKSQSTHATQFGTKPFGSQTTDVNFSKTPFGSTTESQFGQKPQGLFQTGYGYQQTQFSSKLGSNFNQKPQTFGSRFGQNLQSSQDSSITSGTVAKVQSEQVIQTGQKHFSSLQPVTSSFSQTQGTSTFASKFGQKPQSNTGTISAIAPQVQTTSQFVNKPFGSQTSQGSFQQNKFGTFSGSQFGQGTGLGSTGSHFGHNPQSAVDTGSGITPVSQQTLQSGSQTTENTLQQNQFNSGLQSQSAQISQSNQQSLDSSLATSTAFSQFQSGSTLSKDQDSIPVIRVIQKPVSSSHATDASFQKTQRGNSATPQVIPISQYGKRPFVLPQPIQGTDSRFGSSAGSQFVQNVGSQEQTGQTQFGQKPFGSSQTGSAFQNTESGLSFDSQFRQRPSTPDSASAFAASTAVLGNTQTNQVYKHQNQAEAVHKPFGSLETQTAQQHYTQGSSQFGTQSQKPNSSFQTNLQPTQSTGSQKPFGSHASSQQIYHTGSQKTQVQGGIHTTGTTVSSQSSSQDFDSEKSVDGNNNQKIQDTFHTASRFGDQLKPEDQRTQSSQASFESQSSSSKFNQEPSKPLASQQSQTDINSTQFGLHAIEPFEIDSPQPSHVSQPKLGAAVESSHAQFGVKHNEPFNSNVTPATQVSIEQLQSAVSSQVGVKPAQSVFVNPQQLSQRLHSQPSKTVFGSHSTVVPTPISLGFTEDSSNGESNVSTVQTPVSGAELKQTNNRFVGIAEKFGGPRDAPRFSDRTGYHY